MVSHSIVCGNVKDIQGKTFDLARFVLQYIIVDVYLMVWCVEH
jgi:hypothetical protein